MSDIVARAKAFLDDPEWPSDIGELDSELIQATSIIGCLVEEIDRLKAQPPCGADGAVPPILSGIERDESMARDYIPLPGGWEVQTKGSGSTFRLCNTKTGQRTPVLDNVGILHSVLEQMARDIHAASQPAAPVDVAELIALADACSDALFGGEKGWVSSGLPVLTAEARKAMAGYVKQKSAAPTRALRLAGWFQCRPDGTVGQWCPDAPLPLPNGWTRHAALVGSPWDACSLEPYVVQPAAPVAPATVAVPDDVMCALDRMCTPLHESFLKGATAKEDARCMRVIRDYVLGSTVAAPEGYVLAPVNPTREMIAAGDAANDGIVSDIYRAMVSQVVKESFTTAVPRVPFSMPDAAVERIYDAARRSFRRFASSVRGRIVTQADGYEWHVINATLDEVRAMLEIQPQAAQLVPLNCIGRSQMDARMVEIVRHLSKYPATRADEMSAEVMREICRDAVRIYDEALLAASQREGGGT